MKAHGYCLHCRRIRRVNIKAHQLNARIPYGECDDCLERRAEKSRASGSSPHNPRKDTK